MTQEELEAIFLKHDPMGLTPLCPNHEYRPEAKKIIGRLDDFSTAENLADYIHLVFSDMFDPIELRRDLFSVIAEDIWEKMNMSIS